MRNLMVLTLLIVAAVVRADDDEHKKFMRAFEEDIKACSEELHVDDDLLRKFIKHEENVDEKQVGCVKACLLKKREVMVDGKILPEKIYSFIEHMHAGDAEKIEEIKKIADECITKANETEGECEKSLEFMKCHHEHMQKSEA